MNYLVWCIYISRKIRTILQKLQRTFTVNSSIWYLSMAVFVVEIMMENNQEALCLFFPLFYSVFACHLQPCTLCMSTCASGCAASAWEWSSDALLSTQNCQSSFTQPLQLQSLLMFRTHSHVSAFPVSLPSPSSCKQVSTLIAVIFPACLPLIHSSFCSSL